MQKLMKEWKLLATRLAPSNVFSQWNSFNSSNKVISIFADCLAPTCGCMRPYFFDIDDYEDLLELYNHGDEFRHRLNQSRGRADQEVDEYLKASYSLEKSCDLNCHKDCISLLTEAPFDITLQCTRYKCDCWYKLGKPILEQESISTP